MAGKISYDTRDKLYGLAIPGTANSGMTASATTIVAGELAGYGNDYFNDEFYIQVIKNANSAGNAPEPEIRKVTDYASATGTFTTDAFSANVEEEDELYILHASVVAILSAETIMGYFALADMDNFDVPSADADTERWNPEYISGAAGGEADIDTTTADKLYILADYNIGGAERYAVSHNLEMFADFMTITEDVNVTFGVTDGATPKAVGIGVSAGAAYDANNYIFIERQKGTAVDRIQVRSNLNGAGESTTNVAVTDDALAFKLERWDQVWRIYYSTTQDPSFDWVLAARVEDPSNYITNAYTYYQQCFNGSAGDATETAQGDFDNFRYYIGASGGGQYIVGDYNSDFITANVDGNVMERQEAAQVGVGIVAGGSTGFEADGTGHNLFETLIAIDSVTTGAGSTTTFVDTARTEGVDYWNGSLIVALTGSAAGQVRAITDDDGTDTLSVYPALAAAPGTPISYVILKNRLSVPPTADDTVNALTSDVIGNKSDTIPAMNLAPGGTDSQVRHLKAILERLGATPADPDDSVHTILGQRDATADTTAGTASHSAILNAAVAGLGLVDGGTTGFEADGTGHNLYEVLVAIDSVTDAAGSTATFVDSLRTEGADFWNGSQIVALSGNAGGQVRTIVDDDGAGTLTVEPLLAGASGSAVPYAILKKKGADWIVGADNADNAFDSSTVVADDDGSVLERLEFIQTMLVVGEGTFTTSSATVPADTTRTEGNDYWNGCILMPLTGAAAFQPRRIVDYAVTTDVFTIDPNNPFTAATGAVAYIILADQTEFIPSTDGTNDITPSDVVGAKADTADYTYTATTSSLVRLVKGVLGSRVIAEGTLDTSSATLPADSVTAGAKGNDYYNGCLLMTLTGAVAFQPRRIVDFANTTGVFTIDFAAPFTAATGTVAYIVLADQNEMVAPTDGAGQRTLADVVGNPGDTIPAMNAAMASADTIFDVVNAIKERLGATPADADDPLHLIHGQRDDSADFTYDATTGIVPLVKGILGSRVIAEGTLTTDSATVPADTSRTEGNDYFNGCLLMTLTGAVAFQPRRIIDYTVTTDVFTLDPNTPFTAAPGTVAYVIIADQDSIVPNGLNFLVNTADGGTNAYPDSVAQESVLAYLMSKSANPVTTSYDNTTDSLEAISDKLATGAGNLQMAATTIDLQQAAASYDLFTGTTQDVVVERLIVRLPNVDVSDDTAITSISVLSDDVTPSSFLSTAAGAKANLTAEAQLGSNVRNGVLIKTATKIQLTIAGGASDDPTVCDVVAEYRSVVAGGTLA